MARIKKGNPIHGWLNFDKPLGMSSSQAVGYVKRMFNAQKAGHGGTLDPLASGVLPIALGEATKTSQYLLDGDKVYQFTVTWGSSTTTDDTEGEVVKTSEKRPSQEEIDDIVPFFVGEITQTPPMYSALKVDGKRAYELARKGQEVEMKSRQVIIHSLKIVAHTSESTTFEAHVSKGTYIRSLGRDMGETLGCYGHITMLRRIKSSRFEINSSISKEKLDSLVESGQSPETLLMDISAGLDDIPVYCASPTERIALKSGALMKRFHLKPGLMQVRNRKGQVVSLVEIQEGGAVKIARNFNI